MEEKIGKPPNSQGVDENKETSIKSCGPEESKARKETAFF